MSAFNFGKLFSPDTTEHEEENGSYTSETNYVPVKKEVSQTQTVQENVQQPRNEAPARPAESAAFELKVVKPENFASVGQIADHLINRRTIVLNLESTSKEVARRIIDFLNGVAYTLDGQIQAVANNTYIITPCNVGISGEALTADKNPSQDTVQQPVESSGFNGF